MDPTRKRSFGSVDSPPAAQQQEASLKKLAVLSGQDLLDETIIDSFKKDALWRQMNLYKSQLERLQKDSASQDEKISAYQQSFQAIGSQWASLMSLLRNVLDNDQMDVSSSGEFTFQDSRVLQRLAQGEFEPEWFKDTESLIQALVNLSPSPLSKDQEKRLVKDNAELSRENAALKSKVSSLDKRHEELTAKTQLINGDLVNAERKVLRLQSDIVKQFTQGFNSSGQAHSAADTPAEPVSQTPTIDVENVSNEHTMTADNQELLAELQDLRAKHEIARSEADTRGREIQEVQHENTQLIHQLDQAVLDLNLLPEHRVAESSPYRYLETCLQHAKEDLIVYKKQNEDMRHDLELLSAERSSFIEQLMKEEDAKKLHYEAEIKKLNGEVNRIRLMRDNLQQKCDHLVKEKGKPEQEIQQLKSSLELYRKHIEFLMQGINRTKTKLAAETGDEEFYRNVLLSIDLELKDNSESGDLPQYKTIVDGLHNEVRLLRSEMSEADLVLKQNVNQLQTKLDSILSACGDEKVSVEKLLLQLEAHKSTETMAMMEMESIADNYTKLDTKYRETLDMMAAKDDEINRHIAEKVKIEHKMLAIGKEKENVGNKVIALQKSLHKQNELIKRLEEGEQLKTDLIQNLEKENAGAKTALALHENRLREMVQLSDELGAKVEKNSSKYHDLSSLLKQKEDLIADLKHQKRLAEEDARRLEITLKHASPPSEPAQPSGTVVDASGKTVDLDVLQGYKKIAQCNVCNFRIKDRVLRTCWHCFCEECINTRVETRQRKCPQCGQAFGPGDIKPIYI